MKRYPDNRAAARLLLNFALASSIALPLPSLAASVALATEPMATTTASNVKPNVMFILDDSGSMAWNYLPDWANSGTDALFKNAAYNGVYYNPAVTYTPPVLYNAAGVLDTATYPSQTGLTTATGADATAKPNWRSVEDDAYGIQSTNDSDLVGSASFYTIVPGEYCTASDLKTCTAATAPSVTHPNPAPLRWCSSSTNAGAASPAAGSCQAIRIGSYTNARYPKGRIATITVSGSSPTTTSVTSIKIGAAGPEILSVPTATSTTLSTVAANIANAINACSAAIAGNCTVAGFSATRSGNVVTITANAPGAFSTPSIGKSGSMTISASTFSGGNSVPGSTRYIDIIPSTVNYPYPGTTLKATTRTDCAGTACTYSEEMTNFANWWTYYHTRMQAMKTSVSRAFKSLTNNYRVGFSTIGYTGATDGTRFLGNKTFELAHKNSWFTRLFATATPGYTPLRGALSKAGRYYGNRISGQVDPVQYSCQQNFTILSTDGYWNTNDESGSYGPFGLTGANVGNLDGGSTPRPMREGTTAVSNTLADIAKYYYDTDLRTATLGNCGGGISPDFPTGNPDVCTNNVFTSSSDNNVKQHMTSFTMGLGIDGTLNYSSDYADATSGDFYKLKNGLGSPTVNWPDPIANTSEARIDDLWHAAVNGQGTYFSAKDPNQIITGFTKALSAISAKLGSAAAAATSTLNPVAGNNYAYVASYTTVKWKGNLEARSINIDTGLVSDSASWCAENVVAGTCATAPVADTSGSSTIYNCVTPGATAATCTSPGVFDADATTCTTEIANACVGTLPGRVGPATDTRTIYTANDAGTGLSAFDSSYAAAHPTYFDSARISGLSQWGALNAAQQAAAVGVNLINYLRGQNGFEDRAANTVLNRLYRTREAVLGDALESQPSFVSKPAFNYPYPGYAGYKSAYSGRAGTVFMGANDGMLHAFDSNTGAERWAYVPSMVVPGLWKLASADYATHHVNYVNGSPVIADIYCSADCGGVSGGAASWRTILVAGLNGGGRGYYALDITNPVTPVLLWEFTPTTGIGKVKDDNLGYTFGRPIITRKADGTWVVLVTSGYDNGTLSANPLVNNVPAGTGFGYLYVLNASSGAKIATYQTTAGSAANPSGLAQIVARNNEPAGNEVGYVYGGDLQGNLWRFDVNSPPSFGSNPMKFATLNAGGTPQPITTTPILGSVRKHHVVFVGTGKYLEVSDLTSGSVQSLYAIKDDNATTTLLNPRGGAPNNMVPQTITYNGSAREGSKNPVDFDTDRGWYIDFPDVSTGSERVNIDSRLVSGTLVVPTIVPSSTVCSPGGYGWLNYFNYENGWPVAGDLNPANVNVSVKYDSTIVGVNVIYIKGKPVVEVVTSINPSPVIDATAPFKLPSANFRGRRSVWRELIPE